MPSTPATPTTRVHKQYAPVLRTQRGTPCAKSWSDAWIKRVEAVENNLGRNICGAKLAEARRLSAPVGRNYTSPGQRPGFSAQPKW